MHLSMEVPLSHKQIALSLLVMFAAVTGAVSATNAQTTIAYTSASERPVSASSSVEMASIMPIIPADWNFVVGVVGVVVAAAGVAVAVVALIAPKSSSSSSSSASGYTGSSEAFGQHYDPAAINTSPFDD